MASESVSQMIFFIAALIISSGIAAVFISNVNEASSVLNVKSRELVKTIKGDITIINDPANIPHNTTSVIFYVKNTGFSTLPLDKKTIDVFIDGEYKSIASIENLAGNSVWYPSDVVKIVINTNLVGEHTVRIYVNGKVWDEMIFRI